MWNGKFGKDVVVFGVDNGLSVNPDYWKKDISVLGEGPTDGLDDTRTTTEAKYSINITRSRKIKSAL